LLGPSPVSSLGKTLDELSSERHQRHLERVAKVKKRGAGAAPDAAVTRQSGSESPRAIEIEPKTSAPDTIRTCDLSLRKPRAAIAFLGNAEQSAPWSATKSREEDQATVTDAAVTRHRPQAWALAYAYRDVLSRRAAA
jgi:prophage tail gpP-like protein